MARLYLSSGEIGFVGRNSAGTTVFGNEDAQVVNVTADAIASFDPSFSNSGDTINIAGAASIYTAARSGSNLVLTAANGARIVIPVDQGVTVTFAGGAGQNLYYDSGLGQMVLGGTAIPNAGSIVLPGGSGSGGDTAILYNLLVAQDEKDGSSVDDIFRARVVQNSNGEQTNTLGTGDMLDGKGGDHDKLLATVQDASPLNAGPSASIRPETVDIEIAHFTALDSGFTTTLWNKDDHGGSSYKSRGPTTGVELNAYEMRGLDEVGSVGSDDSLTIYNMNTLTDSGVYSERRDTGEVTIRMDHTGNGGLLDEASDLTVLFDQDYLLCGNVTRGAFMTIELMDMDSAISGGPPLLDNPFGSITFKLGGTTYNLVFGTTANTYAELLASVQAALAANPAFANLTASFGADFVARDTDNDPVVNGSAIGRTIVITNSGPEDLEALTMTATGSSPAGKDFHTNFTARDATPEECKIESDIVLNKVGRAGDGGELTVGAMQTDGKNELGGMGVEQFNITVEGDDTQDSSLANLQSTNNTLQCVFVEAAPSSLADLEIGNSETSYYGFKAPNEGVSSKMNNALKDVLVFDASKFNNDVTLHAFFSDEAVAKYMDLTDTADDHTADNANAVYSTGGGNDLVNINAAKENMAVVGTETREDFSLTVNTAAGNDHVQVQIGDGYNALTGEYSSYYSGGDADSINDSIVGAGDVQTVQNWYHNHVLNDNLAINTGDGNDVVETWGATAARINLGAGNDVAYTDNSGVDDGKFNDLRASWVFNSLNTAVSNLQSQTAVSAPKIANLEVVIDFQGLIGRASVGGSVGSLSGVTVSDMTINQAIKAAINNDPVLSALLIAEDGPGRTLIVRSKIDGEMLDTDLAVSLHTTGGLAPGQVTGGAKLLTNDQANDLGFNDIGAGNVFSADGTADRWDSDFNGGVPQQGVDSVNVNNNRVEGATGNDVIVLSSNGVGDGVGTVTSTRGSSIEHVVITGAFGSDTVVNFTAGITEEPIPEIQTFAFAGEVEDGPPVDVDGPPAIQYGTASITFCSYTYTTTVDSDELNTSSTGFNPDPVSGDIPTTAEEVAARLAWLVNDGSLGTAVDNGDGTLTVTSNTVGNDCADGKATAVLTSTAYTEQQTIEFTSDAAVAGTISALFCGHTVSINVDTATGNVGSVFNPAVDTATTSDEIAAALAAAFDALPDVVSTASGDTVTLNSTTSANCPTAVVVTNLTGVNYDVETIQDGYPFGLTAGSVVTDQDGARRQPGFDIFDVDQVLGGTPTGFANNDTDNQEVATLHSLNMNDINVAIIDQVVSGEGSTAATEALRIQEILNANPTEVASSAAEDSLVITIDQATNVGYFYHAANGTGNNDVVVTYLGSVELATYDDASKYAIGNWQGMTLDNFTPLSPSELTVQSFAVA